MAERSGGKDMAKEDMPFKKKRRITLKDMRQPATEDPEDASTTSCESDSTMKKRPNKAKGGFELCPMADDYSSEDARTETGSDVTALTRDSGDVIEAENETAPILRKQPKDDERQKPRIKPCLKKSQSRGSPVSFDQDVEAGDPQDDRRPDTVTNNGGIPSNHKGPATPQSGISEKFLNKYVAPTFQRTSSSVNSEGSVTLEDSNSAGTHGCWFCTACAWPWKRRQGKIEEDIYIEEDPFRKRCSRACLTFIYVLLALVAAVVTYSMVADLVTAMNNPVRSIHYNKVDTYDAPGIAVYPGGAEFLACGHYYNNVVTSKVRLEQLDLKNHNCSFRHLEYTDPYDNLTAREVLVIRGPTSFVKREAIFLHFSLEDETRDFFTVSYFVFPGFDVFNISEDPIGQLTNYHKNAPTFALSAELRMWIKLVMSEAYLFDNSKRTEFNVEYSVVKFYDERTQQERKKHLFFIFFEWKNDIIEKSYLLYTMTPWSIGAGLCGVFLTLHRGYQLAQVGYKRFQKDKQRRSIRKRTIRELQSQQSVQREVKQRRLSNRPRRT